MVHLWKKPQSKTPLAADPFAQFQNSMSRMFEDFFASHPLSAPTGSQEPALHFSPNIDVHETAQGLEVAVELPGLKEDDIHLNLDHDVLSISGEKKWEDKKDKEGMSYYESRYGSFQRRIPLGFEPDREKVQAVFKNGVLKVEVEKSAASKEKSRRIDIKNG